MKTVNGKEIMEINFLNTDSINFQKLKLKINPLLNEKTAKRYLKIKQHEYQDEVIKFKTRKEFIINKCI